MNTEERLLKIRIQLEMKHLSDKLSKVDLNALSETESTVFVNAIIQMREAVNTLNQAIHIISK